jgi:hypothetical protein
MIDPKRTYISPSFTLEHALAGLSKSARETVLKAFTADKAFRMARLAYEVLEPLRFGLEGVPIIIDKWLEPKNGKLHDYRSGGALVFHPGEPELIWDCYEALQVEMCLGQRAMFVDEQGNAQKIHVSLAEPHWQWWEGKHAFEVRPGQFMPRDVIVTPEGRCEQFNGRRPRHLRPPAPEAAPVTEGETPPPMTEEPDATQPEGTPTDREVLH